MRRKALLVLVPFLLAALLWGATQGLARQGAIAQGMMAGQEAPKTTTEKQLMRVTNAQRRAAADKLVELKKTNPLNAAISALLHGQNPISAGVSAAEVRRAAVLDPGGTPDYYGVANYATSPLPEIDGNGAVVPGTGIRKFIDSLPGLGASGANNLGQYIPVANPDTTTYPGADYYVIGLKQYQQKLGSDIATTTLRGYYQINNGTVGTTDHTQNYLGPTIVAQRDRPVRVKFVNELPTGAGGDLFIPADTTVMGAGAGPDGGEFTQNRGGLHLHGGFTPWISDGTPHQWVTPAGEVTTYSAGVSLVNVPDMDGGSEPSGTATFYYSNQQSARLMFYHDHAWGITRLNVYAGEAAPYVLQDTVEDTLVNGGTIPANDYRGPVSVPAGTIPATAIPLVIQDKSFVPTDTHLAVQDPTWDKAKWGGEGSLWFPHVYMPNQISGQDALGNDLGGVSAMGRWDYNPWMIPPIVPGPAGAYGTPVPNPLFGQPGQPAQNPGTPLPTIIPEAFMDTPLVNGTAYPYLPVERKAYRFRILNASNDRQLNLQLYFAKSNTPTFLGGKMPVYRFFNLINGTHFYTASETEKNNVMATMASTYHLDGVAYSINTSDTNNSAPLYRFFNAGKGTHFYTASEAEKNTVIATMASTYTFEGIAYRVSLNPAGGLPVYRFFNVVTGTHFYTASEAEKNTVIATMASTFHLDGVAFYVAPGTMPLHTNSGEVPMVQAAPHPDDPTWPTTWPTDGREGGVPDPAAAGPAMIQFANEGGLLPSATVLPNTPVGYEYFRRTITVLSVTNKTLFLAPAERADVIVDFSGVPAGSKLILYNDAPAPVPAFDARLDYYTGDPDQTEDGGAPTTLAGYGPNTRTVMQFQVGSGAAAQPFNLAQLQTGLTAAYAATQDPPIVPEAVYGPAFNTTFTTTYPAASEDTMTFTPFGQVSPVTIGMKSKAIIEGFDAQFGRMNAVLGRTLPNIGVQGGLGLPFDYVDPVTEETTNTLQGTLIGAAEDGTQIWKVNHQGVDTHVIHFHLVNVQVIARAAADGQVFPPDANEVGWKESVRMQPAVDTIVAMRPTAPTLPFKLPDSIRPLNPALPVDSTFVDTLGRTITNSMTNFGWEYVWHCHLLGHEENDMMRPITLAVSPDAPTTLSATPGAGPQVSLSWTNTWTWPAATSNLVQRAEDANFTVGLTEISVPPGDTGVVDSTVAAATQYFYRVRAENALGVSAWSTTGTATTP